MSKFDARKYFCNHGLEAYPLITLLAMVHFSTVLNGGFQERAFSSYKHVMGVGRAWIPIDTLEMASSTLLFVTKIWFKVSVLSQFSEGCLVVTIVILHKQYQPAFGLISCMCDIIVLEIKK